MSEETQPGKPKSFSAEIPDPEIDPTLASPGGESSVEAAVKELAAFATGWDKKRIKIDWRLRTGLKIFLFLFVIVLNVVWAWKVLAMVRASGTEGSHFHLDNSVLIALVTTSIANFVALVAIVARHLFPGRSKWPD